VRIRFLGTAAGGGLPQWNCACAGCAAARRDGLRRRQDTLAVSGDGRGWYLLNCAPDVDLSVPELRPGPGLRETPLRGVVLTSAELDHTLGLATLREATSLPVYATAPVLAATPAVALLDHYTRVERHPLRCAEPVTLDGGLTLTAVALGAKRPRYAAAGPDAPDWVVALRLTDGGAAMVYAPCLAAWSPGLGDADLLILDGTFFHDDEFRRHTGVDRTARQMGHLPIAESLPLLGGRRCLYTHLNNTNPAARPGSAERDLLRRGAGVAPEGGLLELTRSNVPRAGGR
jgi:pyrroloquinoline quinone biosynthesis protein B